MRRSLRSAFVLGVLAGLVVALLRTLTREARPAPVPLAAPPAPLPSFTPSARTPVPVDLVTPAPEATPEPAPEPVIRSNGEPSDPITGSEEGAPGETPSWVEPAAGGCPDGYPIKAKVSSGIFHRPGGLSYERTNPDRCYADEASAESDGFRAAKR